MWTCPTTMRDDLLYQYERELQWLRRTGTEFARRHPKVAGRLELEPSKCDDPHVERLLEGFAFLAARIHLRMDEALPEFSQALLETVYPHFARPLPSHSVVQFALDREQGTLTSGFPVPRGRALESQPVEGTPCRFRTCYDTTLWPVEITDTRWRSPHELSPPVRAPEAAGVIRVEVGLFPDTPPGELELDRLRLFLDAEPGLAAILYEALLNHTTRILVREVGTDRGFELPASALTPVGFERDEGLLPHPPRSFVGWRLLTEYFAFPEKFLFVDLEGLGPLRGQLEGDRFEILFFVGPMERPDARPVLEAGLRPDTLKLGCTPAVNLFPLTAEPILLDQREHEYLLVPDVRRRERVGVFSVDEVVIATSGSSDPLPVRPLHGLDHGVGRDPKAGRDDAGLYWQATRRPSGWRGDEGLDLYLRFVDRAGALRDPRGDAATIRVTAHNGQLPSRLPFGQGGSDFTLEGGGPVRGIRALRKPTALVEPPLGTPQMWRLVGQLSLNYTSLVDGGVEALRELLRIHAPARPGEAERQIEGVVSVAGAPSHARIRGPHGLSFVRGNAVEIEFDEEHFAGSGAFLLASVLERVLALSVSLNSFCQLTARSRQRRDPIRRWPPRSGWKTLI
jgi:type VI secretion system protein ImpG